MSNYYFTQTLGILHLLRLLFLSLLLLLTEIKISSCTSYLNEFLGFNHQSILFYYILIWISFAFEIYLLVNRLFASRIPQARQSIFYLYSTLCLAYLLASCFTLYAIVTYSHGHVITQHDFGNPAENVIPITNECNILRLIGILFGFLLSILYFLAAMLVHRTTD
ncbi:unnamed protein product [Adineta ricciae]|uniref:Uncharacterized protein n=1 Tax=Adineta ricciae TaxID=249248 RepID=A0A814GJ51_ADIRI|nr:unnamed protein product [Adineta ricciae]CAF0996986.1 unnamed protein product [Adineta ricciae]